MRKIRVSSRRRLFFTISRIVAIFFMGLVAALLIALSQLNLETLRGDLVAILQNATGLPIEIDGSVSWKFSLRPRVELNNVRVPNADWAHNPNGFTARRIDVRLNLVSLFRDQPTIQYVKVYDAAIFLEQNAAGEYSIYPNWDKNAAAATDGSTDASPTAKEFVQPKYPFEDPGLGGVEVRNLTAHLLESTYNLTGFQISYAPNKTGREYSGWIKSAKKVFPFIVSYSEYNPQRKVYPMRIAFSTGGDALIADIALEGTSKAPIDFIIRGDIPDVAALGEILNLDWADMPALRVNIAGGFDWKKLTLRKSSIVVRGSELTLAGSVNWSKQIPEISLDVRAKRISLMELFPGLYNPGRKWRRPNRPLNVFKDIPLYGQEFLGRNLDLHLDVEELIVYRDLSIANIDVTARLRDGAARVDGTVMMGDGDIEVGANVHIDPDGTLNIQAAGIGERIYVGEILRQVHADDLISELPANVEFYLTGRGATLSELMQTVTGPIYIYSVAPGYAHSALVSYMYGADFLTSLRHSIQDLFRSEKKYDQIKISCAAVNVKVRDGLIETRQGVAAETNAINIQLAGNIDLGAETMRLSLATVPVRGLKLSLTGNVVNAIEITGNLAEPDIKISGAAVAGKVASATGLGLLLAPLTGG
ncbi:MAG: AsmA family protein, partial [Alphaproteobacteria bacterium]|nr:AsmA family protein [Alphaproteobacteria bacterium]